MDKYSKIQKNLAETIGKYLSATQSLEPMVSAFKENNALTTAIKTMEQHTENIKKELKETTDILRRSLEKIDWDRLTEFNSYINLIDEYKKIGWSMPQQFLFKMYDEAIAYEAEEGYSSEFIMSKIDDQGFFKEFEDYIITTLKGNRQEFFRSTLKLIAEGYYVHSALHLFSVIEHLLKELSYSDKPSYHTRRLINELQDDLDTLNIKLDRQDKGELFMLYNMFGTYEELLLPELFANHNDEKKNILIQRNPLSHGEVDGSKVTKAECYKLLLIILSLTEVKNSIEDEVLF